MDRLEDLVETTDLTCMASPYLPKTFTYWRKRYIQGANEERVRYADEVLLPKFLSKLKQQYFEAIMNSEAYSRDLDIPPEVLRSSEEFKDLATVMAQWSVEIELAADIVDRAQHYGLYAPPRSQELSFSRIQQEWGSEPSPKQMYCYLLHSMAYLADKAASLIREYIVGLVSTNLTQARNLLIASSIYSYLSGTVPWAATAILGTQTAWLVSGWLLIRLGRCIGKRVDRKQLDMHIAELRVQFATLTGQLGDLNQRGKDAILACLSASPDDRGSRIHELSSTLECYLVKKIDSSRQQRSFDESREAEDFVKLSEVDDWLIIEVDEPQVSQLTKSLFTVNIEKQE